MHPPTHPHPRLTLLHASTPLRVHLAPHCRTAATHVGTVGTHARLGGLGKARGLHAPTTARRSLGKLLLVLQGMVVLLDRPMSSIWTLPALLLHMITILGVPATSPIW